MERPYAPSVLDVPDWLTAPATDASGALTPILTPREMREMTDASYTAFFETVLEKVAGGSTFKDAILDDGRYDVTKYNVWVQKNPERKNRLNEARAMSAPLIEDEMVSIIDATHNTLEDVQRSTLKFNGRKWYLGVLDRYRYGSTHQIEVKTNPMREDSLEALAGRLQSLRRQPAGEVVDVTARESK